MVEAYFDLLKMLNVILFLRIKSGFVKRSYIFLACFDSNCKCNVVVWNSVKCVITTVIKVTANRSQL